MGHLPDGAHTHADHGGGLGPAVAAGAGLFIGAAVLQALLAILHVLLIAAAAVVGLALAAAAAAVIWRLRRRGRPAVVPWQAGALSPPRRRPVPGPREVHLHLHGATADDIAAALAQLPAAHPDPLSHEWHHPAWRSPDNPPHT